MKRSAHRLKPCRFSTWRCCPSRSDSASPIRSCGPSHRRPPRRHRTSRSSTGCPRVYRRPPSSQSRSCPRRKDGRSARTSRAPAAPAATPAARCSGPTSSTTTTARRASSSTSRPAGWRPRAARTSTPTGRRPATAPTSSASPSGSANTHTWWRVDWNTLLDPTIPIALFTFDTDRGRASTDEWPAGAGITLSRHRPRRC